jgi:hypothetical protein
MLNCERRIPMKRCLLFFCLMLMLPLFTAFSEEEKDPGEKVKPSIKGVWTIVEMDIGSGDNKETSVPKAFMLYIMDEYYSSIRDLSQKEGSTSSGGAYGTSRSFMADAGTYEYDGSTFVVHHLVSMMGGGGASMTFGCKMEGNDILILSPQYDKLVMPGMSSTPSAKGNVSGSGMAVRYKFKRLE